MATVKGAGVGEQGMSLWDRALARGLAAGKARIVAITSILLLVIVYFDWVTGPAISLGLFYELPMLLASIVLSPFEIVALALLCTLLRLRFGPDYAGIDFYLRFGFGVISFTLTGLFGSVLVKNRKMAEEHVHAMGKEHALRHRAEEHLRTLVQSSPAGILTLDSGGRVLAANNAAAEIFGLPPGVSLAGKSIERYLPVLSDALHMVMGDPPFRTAAQAQGRRDNGEVFLADTWFSTYSEPEGSRLAAIVVDSSDEMRSREEENLRQLGKYSRIMAGAMLHEIRNLSSAIAVAISNLPGRNGGSSPEMEGLEHLAEGLARVASLELTPGRAGNLESISLKQVLDDLRIVVEPSWREIDGAVRWDLPPDLPKVVAERHGLLQALLNLAENSVNAVQDSPVRELTVSVHSEGDRAFVRFLDTGHGVAHPERLFQPFQAGAESTGLGLYISRSLLRSYGGDLKFEPREKGAAFLVELTTAPQSVTVHA